MPQPNRRLEVLDAASRASGTLNEDRGRASGSLAWVIDGATDVVDEPLTSGGSDAAWFAAFLDGELARLAGEPPAELVTLPALLAERAAAAFAAAAQRPPRERAEHPSASGIIARAGTIGLDYLAIGDCTLLAETPHGVVRIGTTEEDSGDKWLAAAIAVFHEHQRATEVEPAASAEAARAHVWPRIRAVRNFMNRPEGYGVFSITPTPPEFVTLGQVAIADGACALLASDGLMRLVDIFGALDTAGLLAAAKSRGLAALLDEVRALETADAACRRFPRAKVSDDATGILIRLAPSVD